MAPRSLGFAARRCVEREDSPATRACRDRLPSLQESAIAVAGDRSDWAGHPDCRRARRASDLHASTFDVSFVELTLNNEAGSIATDKLSARVQGTVRASKGDWQFDVDLSSAQGQAYAQPIFRRFRRTRIACNAAGRVARHARADDRALRSRSRASRASERACAGFDFANEKPLRSLTLQLAGLEFPGAYESYLQPLLLDTNFKSMQTAGKIAGDMTIEDGAPRSVDLTLRGPDVRRRHRQVRDGSTRGAVHWRADTQDETRRRRCELAQRLDLRAVDGRGRVAVQQQRAAVPACCSPRAFRCSTARSRWKVFACATPVCRASRSWSMRRSSRSTCKRCAKAFGWPEFGGRDRRHAFQAAHARRRHHAGHHAARAGVRRQVTISDLRLQQPFGQWPRFYSNVALDNLDLELMTGAFSFGRITGPAVRTRRWAAAVQLGAGRFRREALHAAGRSFEASHQPACGREHRQHRRRRRWRYRRTVERLPALLRRLQLRAAGFSCRLQNDVCAMDGIAPAPNGGYYLVKGKGLPRIDVIGSSRRVDWPRLVQQLIAATESGGPTVK